MSSYCFKHLFFQNLKRKTIPIEKRLDLQNSHRILNLREVDRILKSFTTTLGHTLADRRGSLTDVADVSRVSEALAGGDSTVAGAPTVGAGDVGAGTATQVGAGGCWQHERVSEAAVGCCVLKIV